MLSIGGYPGSDYDGMSFKVHVYRPDGYGLLSPVETAMMEFDGAVQVCHRHRVARACDSRDLHLVLVPGEPRTCPNLPMRMCRLAPPGPCPRCLSKARPPGQMVRPYHRS